MRRFPVVAFLIYSVLTIHAQLLPNRYQEVIFPAWEETSGTLFSTGVPEPNPGGGFYEFITGFPLNVNEYDTDPVNLYMDIFEPVGDTLSKRPAIIICFGGGFLSGSKDHWSIRLLAQEFAKRGYVTATIDYRLGMNIFDPDLAMRAVYRGIQDGRSAVRFFRADAAGANLFRVDPDNIFIGGHSAGAFISLHNAYLDKETERPISTFEWIQSGQTIPDLGCLDCAGDNTGFSGHANAVFSLAGALGFTEYIETAMDKQVVMFHSTDDGTVPYNTGEPFGNISYLIFGSDLPVVFGSLPISIRAAQLGLPYSFYSYTDRGHGVHEDGGSNLYPDIVPGINDWFFTQHLKPESHVIAGISNVCQDFRIQSYAIDKGDAVLFDWQIIGGNFLVQSPDSNAVEIEWDDTSEIHQVLVMPYNALAARGDTQTLNVTILPVEQNIWIGTSGNWNTDLLWSRGNVPTRCDEVILPLQNLPIQVNIPDNDTIEVRSINMFQNVTLDVGLDVFLHLNRK